MKRRALEWAARLYPARWRQRYGAEFGALLEESGGGWPATADVLKGALAMQMRSWNVWQFVGICAVIGAAIAGVVSWRIPKAYESTAVLRMDGDESMTRERLGPISQEVLSQTTLSTLITTLGLYKAERAQRPIEDVIQDIRAHIYTQLVAGIPPTAFKVSFIGSSPAQAKYVTGLLVSQFINRNFEASAVPHPDGLRARMEVLDPPTLPQRPRSPNRPMMMTLGILLGVVLGLLTFSMAILSRRGA
jgi:hypothetical protein